jgi:hypothetical protein
MMAYFFILSLIVLNFELLSVTLQAKCESMENPIYAHDTLEFVQVAAEYCALLERTTDDGQLTTDDEQQTTEEVQATDEGQQAPERVQWTGDGITHHLNQMYQNWFMASCIS